MKTKRIEYGLRWNRIASKNAWMHCQVDEYGREYVALMSYDTPIMLITHYYDEQNYVNIAINENAYKYSRTTSKQITQFISELHLFTSWSYPIPFNLRGIIELCRTDDSNYYDEYYEDDLLVIPCTESQLESMLHVARYTTGKTHTLELYQIR